jgi:hypothetical protein
MKPFSEALYKEMLARIKQTDLSVPCGAAPTSTTRHRRGQAIPDPVPAQGQHGSSGGGFARSQRDWQGQVRRTRALAVSDDQNLLAIIDFVGFASSPFM